MKAALAALIFFLQFKPVVLEQGSFWHITDLHYDETYLSPTDPDKICNSQTPGSKKPNQSGQWGSFLCDSPWSLINSSVFAMKDMEPDPDFIIWTGDNTPHVPNSELGTQRVIQILYNITELLSTVFPNTTVYPALGNHDYHPKNQIPTTPNDIFNQLGDLWSRWIPPDAVATFKKGGFYTVLIKPGFRLVILNTIYYYVSNKLTPDISDPADQFAWLDGVLTNASRSNEKVFIVGHVPPGVSVKEPGDTSFYPQFNKKYIAAMLKHADVITGQFMSHKHFDTFKIFYDNKGRPRSSLFLCPAISPWSPTVYTNPTIRLIKYDKTTANVKDVWQYFLNLTQANLMDKPDWRLKYKAIEVFTGLSDMTPQSLHSLVQSFKPEGSANFRKYFSLNAVSAEVEPCDEKCKTAQICGITKVDFDEYDDCVKGPKVVPSHSSSVKFSRATVAFLQLVVFVVLFKRAFISH